MATLALAAAGNAVLPGIGGVIGGLIGSVIDNRLLAGSSGGRLDDLRLGSASEGAPKNYCFGAESRVEGQLIWCPLAIEVPPGGKGSASATSSTYVQDLAVAFAGHQIEGVVKILANGSVIWNDSPSVSYSDTHISAAIFQMWQYNFESDTYVIVKTLLDLNSTALGPDLSKLKSGLDATVGGFVSGAAINNGTWRVVSSSLTGGGASTCRLDCGTVTPVATAAGATVTVSQILPKFSTKTAASFTFYNGLNTQVANALMESYELVGNVPGYRRDAYVVIEHLDLTPFGNRVPSFNAVVKTTTGETIGGALGKIMDRCVPEAGRYDVSAATAPLRGFYYTGPTAGRDMATPLLVAFDILTQERDGKIVFIPRASAETIDVDEADLAAHDFGSDAPRILEINDIDASRIPSQVSVSYSNPDADYQAGSQTERRINFANDQINTLNLRNVVMTDEDARTIGRRVLWTAIANRQTVKLQLPPSYMRVLEGDRLRITINGLDLIILVQQRTRGANWLLEIEGVIEEASTLTWDPAPTDDTSVGDGDIYTPPEMRLDILDLPPLADAQNFIAGFYFAAACWDIEQAFAGAALLQSINGGSTFIQIAQIPAETTMGFASTVLATCVPYYWDRKSIVRVVLIQGELASVAEEDCLNGENTFLIGAEIVSAATCTLISENTYDLKNLIRGRRATESFISGHQPNERVTLLNSTGMQFYEAGVGSIGTTRQFKSVPAGGLPGNFGALTQKLYGNTLRPLPPFKVRGQRNAAGDITISWFRRTRGGYRIVSGVIAPLLDTQESYEIDILNDAETAVLITLSVSGIDVTSIVYLATGASPSQQAQFGSGPHANVHVKVYQISSVVGRGGFTKEILT